MRLRLKLRGIHLPYHGYVWGGFTWHRQLFDTSYELDSDCTKYTEVSTGNTASTTPVKIDAASDEFICPLFKKPIQILDGTIMGRIKLLLRANTDGTATLTEIKIKIKKMDSEGNVTILAEYTTGTIADNETSLTLQCRSYPFFFQINNQKIAINERILWTVDIYGKYTPGTGSATFGRSAAINTDDYFIDIPMV